MLRQKFIILTLIILSCTNFVQASFSTTYELNEESLSYGSNAEFLESTSYMIDLGDMGWVDRNLESASYNVIDGNSMFFDTAITPPTPPTPPPTGGAGGPSSIAGGVVPHYDSDSPVVTSPDQIEDRDLNEFLDDQLYEAAEVVEDASQQEEKQEQPVQLAYVPAIQLPEPELIAEITEKEVGGEIMEPPLKTTTIVNKYYIVKGEPAVDSGCGCFRWDFLIIIIILSITLILVTLFSNCKKRKK